jgi:hypothetical protein
MIVYEPLKTPPRSPPASGPPPPSPHPARTGRRRAHEAPTTPSTPRAPAPTLDLSKKKNPNPRNPGEARNRGGLDHFSCDPQLLIAPRAAKLPPTQPATTTMAERLTSAANFHVATAAPPARRASRAFFLPSSPSSPAHARVALRTAAPPRLSQVSTAPAARSR